MKVINFSPLFSQHLIAKVVFHVTNRNGPPIFGDFIYEYKEVILYTHTHTLNI